MNQGSLNPYFDSAFKTLSQVEISSLASNQMEFNGTKEIRNLLGDDKKKFHANFYWLGPTDTNKHLYKSSMTWYQSRKPPRSEYRLYHGGMDKISIFKNLVAGDFLAILWNGRDELNLMMTSSKSVYQEALIYLLESDNKLIFSRFPSSQFDEACEEIMHNLKIYIPDVYPLPHVGIDLLGGRTKIDVRA